jgi:dipeptidyl aminopeptidase/acylaminoacyl peptidase
MQDDVMDGLQALIDAGKADPERVCFVGGSYGGYVALMAAVQASDRIRCAVSINGVTDLVGMVEWAEEQFGPSSPTVDYLKRQLGDPDQEEAVMRAHSPLHQVERIEVPVFLIHGADDKMVPLSQSELFAAALEQAGKEHSFEIEEGAGHLLATFPRPSDTLETITEFVADHIDGDR